MSGEGLGDKDVKTSTQTVQNSGSKIPSRLHSAWGLEGLSQKLKCAAGTKRSQGPPQGHRNLLPAYTAGTIGLGQLHTSLRIFLLWTLT